MSAAQALAGHLPRVSESHASACSHLLALLASAGVRAQAAAPAGGRTGGWQIELDSDYGPLGFLPLRGSGRPLGIASRGDAPDLAEAGAALKASEALICALERALDTPLWPAAIRPDARTDHGSNAVRVRIDADGGDCAMLSASPDLLRSLPAPRWHLAPRSLLALNVPCRIRIGGCTVDARRLAAVGPGDLLLQTLGTGPRWTVQVLAHDGPKRDATFDPASATLSFHTEEPVDMDPLPSPCNAAAVGSDLAGWSRIGTELRFELPSVNLPLGTVAGLQAGAVLRIPAAQGALSVDVLAGDRPIARGELVAIGDGYGVRLVERLIDGP
jgi:type III secretion protein Q